MKPRTEHRFPALEEIERCAECSHVWDDNGPAHFTDCRYFSLDDDRDEDPIENQRTLEISPPLEYAPS